MRTAGIFALNSFHYHSERLVIIFIIIIKIIIIMIALILSSVIITITYYKHLLFMFYIYCII